MTRTPRRPSRPRPVTPTVPHRRIGPRIWLTHHGRAVFTTLGQLWRARASSFATMAALGIALAFPANLWLLVRDMSSLVARFQGAARIEIYLEPQLGGGEATKLAARIEAAGGVRRLRVIDRHQALTSFLHWSGLDLRAQTLLGPHPLPAVIEITPLVSDPRAVRLLARRYARYPGVWQVHTDARWLRHLRLFLAFGRRLVVTLVVLFSLAALLVIANTIRLDVENARDEITILKMVGATDSFVRRPFLYRGMLYGLGGGLVSWIVCVVVTLFLSSPLGRLGRQYDANFQLHWPSGSFLLVLLASGAALGWLGAGRAVRTELKQVESRL